MSKQLEYLKEPLTIDDVLKKVDENNYIEGVVAITEEEYLEYKDGDDYIFSEFLFERLCEDICFDGLTYDMVGDVKEEGLILYHVSADISDFMDDIN